MTWPEAFASVFGTVAILFFLAVILNGWPGQKGDD